MMKISNKISYIIVGLLLIMLLVLYPTIELSRMILINGWSLFPELKYSFVMELVIIWICYFAIIPTYLLVMKTKKLGDNESFTKIIDD